MDNSQFTIKYHSQLEKSEFVLEVAPISDEFTVIDLIKDAKIQLNELVNQNIFTGFKILKITGRLPLPIAYLFAHEFQHFFSTIAVYYPQNNVYVITNSTDPNYHIGDSINPITNEKIAVKSSEKEAFTAHTSGDILYVDCTVGIKEGNLLAKEVNEKIDRLIENKEIKGGKLLKINGKSSVLTSFIIAHKVCHLYANILVFDPKINGYVTVIRHGGEYAIGNFIPENLSLNTSKKIVIGGNANRGKTLIKDVLRIVLSQYLDNKNYYLVSGCPDGDGAWYNQLCQNNLTLARQLKDKYKASFTLEFAHNKAQEIRNINNPLLIFDVGGKTINNQLTPENEIIMAQATHAIIIGADEAEITIWRDSCQALNLKIIAEIITKTESGKDTFEVKNDIFTGTIHQLQRGNNIVGSIVLNKLAEYLVI
ncbi:hypothetical protein ACN4EE_09910 [Geminocystis sp. CENA526]|uniref:hypothetical protein n=1 Tax=Geminocystis sp. CENA526 TaxID=1355871 RepID=UPI003D6E1D65